MVSALMVGLIIIATLNGFDVASRATGAERGRAQADALAQQAEDNLRSLPISKLELLEGKPLVASTTENGTAYTVTSTAEYRSDATATSSCNSSAKSSSYIRTISTVTWPSARKPVVESGIISPPPGSALIVQVTDGSGVGVPGMFVTATGPEPGGSAHTLETAANGCAILALLPGEYTINVKRTGYVDQNWYSESEKDPTSTHSVYLTAESAIKEPYSFALASKLKVKFVTKEVVKGEGDSFMAFNSGMSSPQPSTATKYQEIVESEPRVFPFTSSYNVYAGACEADNPVAIDPTNKPTEVSVLPGLTTEAQVTQPPINVKVMSGTSRGVPGEPIENAKVTLTDKGCGTKRETTTTAVGTLQRPGVPFGEYSSLCVTGGPSGGTKGLGANKIYTTASFENDTPAGPSELPITNGGAEGKFAIIYLGAGTPGSACP